MCYWYILHFTGIKLDLIDICDQVATSPAIIDRLADLLLREKLISNDTCQTVKADTSAAPYSRASLMIRPAIEHVRREQEMHKILVDILQQFNLCLQNRV